MIKHFTVWTKDNCGYCVRAKQLLLMRGHQYEEKKVAPGFFDIKEMLEVLPTARTFPQILLDGELIGGYDELVKHFEKHRD